MSDYLTGAIDRVGSAAQQREQEAQAAYIAMRKQEDAQNAQKANAIARFFDQPAGTVSRNLDAFSDQVEMHRDLATIREAPGLQSWIADPRNAAGARGDVPALGTTSLYLDAANWSPGQRIASGLPGIPKQDPSYWKFATGGALDMNQIAASARAQARLDDAHEQDIQAARPKAGVRSVLTGIRNDVVQGWKKEYYGAATFMADALGLEDVAQSYVRARRDASEVSDRTRPLIQNWLANDVYSGIVSTGNALPIIATALATDGGSLAVYFGALGAGVQTGSDAYGKYRERGATANEAALGAAGEGLIESGTEYLPLGHLLAGVGKKGMLHFGAKYIGEELVGEEIATFGQDALDTAIANPTATWSQFWADRPQAALDTAVAVVTQSVLTAGGAGAYHSLRRTNADIHEATEAMAGVKFMDRLVGLAQATNLAKNDPEGYRNYVQQHVGGTRLENLFISAEAVRSLFQSEGGDYHADPFWAKYAAQIDEGADKGAEVVIPLGDAAAGFASNGQWEKLRGDVRMSPGGQTYSEAAAITESYQQLMEGRGQAAGEADRAQREAAAPAVAVYNEVLSLARQAGMGLRAATTYAELYATRYATRAEVMGENALDLFHQSIGGITHQMPSTLRPYQAADQADLLIHAMRRQADPVSTAKERGPSLLQFIAARGGVTDPQGELASLGADKWHRDAPFRRRLIRAGGDAAQGDMIGGARDAHSLDHLFEAAIEAGYFPQYNAQRLADDSGSYADKPDIQAMHDAIRSELHGSPVYASEERAPSEVDRNVKAAAEDLRGFLENRGIDPDEASPEDIKAALADRAADPARAFFEQSIMWNVKPEGASDLILHHNGPVNLPRGRPTGALGNYFGTSEFSDAVGTDFGPWRYTFWVPTSVADKIVDLGERRGAVTLFHGSPNASLTVNDVQIIGGKGRKQGSKYGGFYAAGEADVAHAEGYAGKGGTVYRIDLKPGAVIEDKPGDITRLSSEAIAEYRARGVDVVRGKDPRGRTEYAIINRDAIDHFGERGQPTLAQTIAAEAALAAYPDDTEFADALRSGDQEALADFYEIWADSANLQPVLEAHGLAGARFDQEHFLTPDAIAQLRDRRNGPDDGTMTFYQSQPEHPVFYSALAQAVNLSKLAKAPAAQWKATIANTAGVKAEEVEWSGLNEWLDLQQGNVSREAISAFLDAGGVAVDEVLLGDYSADTRARVDAIARTLYEAEVARRAHRILDEEDDPFFEGDIHVAEVVEVFDDYDGEGPVAWEFDGVEYDSEARAIDAQNDAIETAAAENERQRLRNAEAQAEAALDEEDFMDEAKAKAGALTHFGDYTSTNQATETYRELLFTLPLGERNNPGEAPDTHWDKAGVVAHMRFQAKTDVEGRPVLFLEEVQSDWHQKGRSMGYRSESVNAEEVAAMTEKLARAQERASVAMAAITAHGHEFGVMPADEVPVPERGYGGFVLGDQPLDEQASYADVGLARTLRGESSYGRPARELTAEDVARIEQLRAEYKQAWLRVEEARRDLGYASRPQGIPDAPFKTSWPALVMKRAIRWAVDNGYHSVAWTMGDEQIARYGLAHSVGSISTHLITATGYEGTRAFMFGNPDVTEYLLGAGLAENTLPGKPYAAALTREQAVKAFGEVGATAWDRADEGNAVEPFHVETPGMQVGGDGMRGFYDNNLIKITNGLIKKYDARVSRQLVAGAEPPALAVRMETEARSLRQRADENVIIGEERLAQRQYDDANAAMETAQQLRDAEATPQWAFPITPELADAARKGFALFQGGDTKARGRVDFAKDGRALISLFEGSDLSTLLHESVHVWLEELKADANRANAPAQVVEDWATVRAWFKDNGHVVTESGDIPTEAHELFARGGERYFMEGKPPTAALARAFSSFRSWLIRVYKVVANLNTPLTDEVRGVMDRLFATQEAIDNEAYADNIGILPQSLLSATDAEYAAMKQAAATVRTEAFDAALHVTMEAIRREKTAEWKRDAKAVREDIEKGVDARPEFKALAALRGRGVPRIQLSREAIVNEYGEDMLTLLPRGVPPTVVERGGVHPDILAEQVGFKTGREMVDMLVGIEKRQRALRLEQDRRSVREETIDLGVREEMLRRYGDPLGDGSIEEEAVAALRNDARSDVLSAELRMLARRRASGTVVNGLGDLVATPWAVAKDWAARVVREGKVADNASAAALARHRRNEVKAGRAAEKALLAGDLDEAFKQKHNQLYAHALYRASKEAKESAEVILRRLGRYVKSRGMPSIDSDYLDRIHQLLEAYDLKPRSAKERAERSSFFDWARAKEEAGEEVHVPPRLADAGKVNFKDISVEELTGLDDAVQSLAHLGRRKRELLANKEKADLAEYVDKAVADAADLPSRKVTGDRNERKGWRSSLRGLDAIGIKTETLFDFLDNDNPNGQFNKLLVRGATTAANLKETLVTQVLQPLADLYHAMPTAQQRRMVERVVVPEFVTRNGDTGEEGPTTYMRSELIAVALNIGNESNFDKMVRGESRGLSEANAWTQAKVLTVLNRELNAQDWAFVQEAWRLVETLWPHIVRAEKEITGVVPEKVQPRIVATEHGTFNGGYWPVVYDPARSAEAAINYEDDAAKMLGQMGKVIGTPKGHTITRTNAAAPLLFSLEAVLFNHVNRVTTRIAYGRFIRDALKFTRNAKIVDLINRKFGPEYNQTIQYWLRRQVNDASLNTSQLRAIDGFLRKFRVNATLVGLGFRFTTMLAQAGGFAMTVKQIGPKYTALGMADAVRNLGELRSFVFSRSQEMAGRAESFDRDVRTFFRDAGDRSSKLDKVRGLAFWGIGNVQLFIVDIPTFLGAYRKGLDQGMTEDESVAFAEKAVRKSQGAGRAKDLSEIQDGSEPYRTMTTFYSFWNVFYNSQREAIHDARRGDWRKVSMNVFWAMMVAPVLSAFLTGDWPDDESDEGWFHWALRKMFFGLWGGVPVLREVGGSVERKVTGKAAFPTTAPAFRAFDEASKPVADLVKVAKGDEPSDRWLQNAITAPGYFVGLPTGQAGATAQYGYDWATGAQHPGSVADVYTGLTHGPQKDQR